MEKLIITRPDDLHVHVRSGSLLKTVAGFTARQFGRAVIMPNLKPPVTTVAEALQYRTEILQAAAGHPGFEPLMTLYLTNTTTVEEVKLVSETAEVVAFKLYPAGATTNSDAGVAQLQQIFPLLEAMQRFDVPLLIHGEVTDPECDIFDREAVFIETQLKQIMAQFPALRIVLEHITTDVAVQFVAAAPATLAATITPQHLLYNRNAMLVGGIKPHFYCLPILKREQHRLALIKAAISGSSKFFLGTDSAPHLTHLKENACGCAGCFTAPAAIELYAEVFAAEHALNKLEGFASFYGADFYRLPRNTGTITLIKNAWTVPTTIESGKVQLTPLKAGEVLAWQLA